MMGELCPCHLIILIFQVFEIFYNLLSNQKDRIYKHHKQADFTLNFIYAVDQSSLLLDNAEERGSKQTVPL